MYMNQQEPYGGAVSGMRRAELSSRVLFLLSYTDKA
jgi:hypothetical protein